MTTMTAAWIVAHALALAEPAEPQALIVPGLGVGPAGYSFTTFQTPGLLAGPELATGLMVRVGEGGAHYLEVQGHLLMPVVFASADAIVVDARPALLFSVPTLSVGGGTTLYAVDDFGVRLGLEADVGLALQATGDVLGLVVAPGLGLHTMLAWQTSVGAEVRLRVQGRTLWAGRDLIPTAAMLAEVAFPIAIR